MKIRRHDVDHDMTFGRGLGNYATNAESTQHNVETRLLTLFGEWFLDTSAGVPYIQDVTTKPANLALIESVIKEMIMGTIDVTGIALFDIQFDHPSRQLTVTATLQTVYNENVPIQIIL